jgi:hypothetical protein
MMHGSQSFCVEVIEVFSPGSTSGSVEVEGVSSGSKCRSG